MSSVYEKRNCFRLIGISDVFLGVLTYIVESTALQRWLMEIHRSTKSRVTMN